MAARRELARRQRRSWPWNLQGSKDVVVQNLRSANNMNDATQPLSPGADQSHAASLLLGPEPCDSVPVSADSRASSRSLGRQSLLRRTSENECCATCKEAWIS